MPSRPAGLLAAVLLILGLSACKDTGTPAAAPSGHGCSSLMSHPARAVLEARAASAQHAPVIRP